MNRKLLLGPGLLLVAIAGLLTFNSTAVAHERRAVGSYTFVVGWLNEPAYLNEPNAVDLRVTRANDSSPVTGLEQSLKAEVTQGDKKTELQLRPRFNSPGAYDGRLMPTAEGVYSFRIFGTIEGAQINETFTASESTFAIITTPPSFPNEYVSSQNVNESLQGIEQRLVSLEDDDSSDGAMIVGVLGVVLGAAGLGTAAFALMRTNRS
jgi:hypothetical protein